MSSRRILRGAPVQKAPLIIGTALVTPTASGARDVPEQLLEELQYEHPDAEPEEIEDAIEAAMRQLRQPADETLDEPVVEPPPDLGFETFDAETDPAFVIDARPEPDESVIAQEAQQTAGEVLENARREAQRVLAEADDRAAEIERAAYEKGYAEGVEAGRADGEQQASELVKQVVAIVDRATELHDTRLREAEAEMVALCLEIARKTIHAELLINPDVVKSVVAEAVGKINGSPRVTIKLNPSQVEAVREHWDRAFGSGYREKEWAFEADPDVEPGGCILDTRYGSIDARIETQFSEIQKTFALLLGTDSSWP